MQAPAPGRYLIGPLNLTSGQTLQVDLGATLLGSTNLSDQIVVDKFPSYQHSRSGYGCRYQALIGAYNQTNVKVWAASKRQSVRKGAMGWTRVLACHVCQIDQMCARWARGNAGGSWGREVPQHVRLSFVPGFGTI